MAYTLSNKCAKNCCKRTIIVQVIIKDVVMFFWTQCIIIINMSYSIFWHSLNCNVTVWVKSQHHCPQYCCCILCSMQVLAWLQCWTRTTCDHCQWGAKGSLHTCSQSVVNTGLAIKVTTSANIQTNKHRHSQMRSEASHFPVNTSDLKQILSIHC